MVVAVELVSDVTDSDRYRKTLRIKSYKAFEWLQSERTTYDLLTACLISQALELIMWTFMQWQRDEVWLSLETAPLVQMASAIKSPAVRAINGLSNMMKTDEFSTPFTDGIDVQVLAEGYGWGLKG